MKMKTALHHAADSGDHDAVSLLLRFNADPNATDNAVCSKQPVSVFLLLRLLLERLMTHVDQLQDKTKPRPHSHMQTPTQTPTHPLTHPHANTHSPSVCAGIHSDALCKQGWASRHCCPPACPWWTCQCRKYGGTTSHSPCSQLRRAGYTHLWRR